MPLDKVDIAILHCLQRDGRMSVRGVAEAIGMSKSVVGKRIVDLKVKGVILGFRAVIAPSMLGGDLDLIASYHLRASNPIAFRCFELNVRSIIKVLSFCKIGPGAYQIRASKRLTFNKIEQVVARCGLTIVQCRIEPILEEFVPYRDPPLRILYSDEENSENDFED